MINNYKVNILGISASLRNARRGLGNISLIEDLEKIKSKDALFKYIEQEALEHLNNFNEAGRKDNIPFDQMYRNLKKLKGNRGLSNSEVALTSALWSAKELGADIEHLSLSEYFHETSDNTNLDELKKKLVSADGIIISTPVYFGDRGSLAQSLINLIKNDADLLSKLKGKVYGGIAVGAKRNGGQETTLIYQLMDMLNCGLLGVGNDSETTSQYGGTGLAGDIGTMSKDSYGLSTAMGTGRRVARVASFYKDLDKYTLEDKNKIVFWVLQDKDNRVIEYVKELVKNNNQIDALIIDIANKNIIRCIACDICPIHVGLDEEYRCIIKTKRDDFNVLHDELIDADAIIPVALSSVDRTGIESNYQRFLERTRYLRRGDYIFSDIISAPLVLEELGSAENLNIRMITSMIRHHTIISKPIIAYFHNNKELNHESVISDFDSLNKIIRQTTKARLRSYLSGSEALKYKPVGYVLSAVKDSEDERLQTRNVMINERSKKALKMAENRLKKRGDKNLSTN